MFITDCKTNHLTNPLGYQIQKPTFSYVVCNSKGTVQTEARICISLSSDMYSSIYDTGFTDQINSIAYVADLFLRPRQRYYWTVTVRTDAGEEACSDMNWFETGKLDEEWQGKWITCTNPSRHPIFVKELPNTDLIKNARLYICGLGLYEAYVDGCKISEELLTPYCTNYQEWVQYQTYDVTADLTGAKQLEVLLGNGWYKGRFGFDNTLNQKPYYGNSYKLIAELHIEYEDDSKVIIGTDENWKVISSQITDSSIYDGETVNATLTSATIENAIFCADEMLFPSERLSTPVTVHELITPIALIHTPAGENVLDLGQNIAGTFTLCVHEAKDTVVHLQFGEVLQNGNFYRENLRTAKAEYTYISDGTKRIISPHFTYYGYRYVKVEGIKELKISDFTGLAFYSAIPSSGTLTTGNALVNQLISNTIRGQKGNFIDVPTDCPQRDERMGWTGDAMVFSATSCFLADSYAFFRKYLHDIAMEQKSQNGLVPKVVPAFGYKGTSSVWGDAACIIPWNLYLFYGDSSILSEQYESMKSWVDYITFVDGDYHGWSDVFHFGDWLALDGSSGRSDNTSGATDTGFIANVYYANSARIVSETAALLGNKTDALAYRSLSRQILKDITAEYFSATGRPCINTQTGLLLTLEFNLSKDKERIRKMLLKKFEECDNKLQTGFIGTSLLCTRLAAEGMDDLAYQLLLNEDYPGWLYAVNLGATTIWERWNSILPDGSISSSGMNSLNHYAYGSVVEFLYRYGAGINPVHDSPGFRKVKLTPLPNYQLGYLDAEYKSPAGTYHISWRIIGPSHLSIDITIPFGCTAELTLPLAANDPKRTLSAGTYHFTYETIAPLKKIYSCANTLKELLSNPQTRKVLEQIIPTIGQTPVSMQNLSFQQLLLSRNPDGKDDLLKKIDRKLGEI